MTTLRKKFPLRKRKILKKCFRRGIRSLSMALIGSVVFFVLLSFLSEGHIDVAAVFNNPSLRPAVLAWGLGISLYILRHPLYEVLHLLTYFYDMTDTHIIIRKGIVSQREIILPFSRITDVYIDQDVMDRVLGLYDLHLSTPTVESGLSAHINGVDKKGAEAIKNLVLQRLNTPFTKESSQQIKVASPVS